MKLEERVQKDFARGMGAKPPVLFYRPQDENGIGSNFSRHGFWLPHPFTGEMCWYSSGEHRFQAMKGTNEREHNFVNAAGTAAEAKGRGRQVKLRDGWGDDYGSLCWYVMFETLIAKSVQNEEVWDWLACTGDALIYEHARYDAIWGLGADNTGKNLLGRCWMDVRYLVR